MMYVVGVDLVKVYKALIRRLVSRALCPPSDVCVRSFLCLFYHNKTSATRVSEAWSLSSLGLLLWRSRI